MKGLKVKLMLTCVVALLFGMSPFVLGTPPSTTRSIMSNPDWFFDLDSAGYSDFAWWGLSPMHFWSTHELLSGEWSCGIYYDGVENSGADPNAPAGTTSWLTDLWLFPDWTSNSAFKEVSPITTWDNVLNPVVGFDTGYSAISNGQVKVSIDFEMVDLGVDVSSPMGIIADPCTGAYVGSDRYVMLQTYTITNVSDSDIQNLQLYQMLHSHGADEYGPFVDSVYDSDNYGDPLAAYVPYNPIHKVGNFRYDITQWNNLPGSMIGGMGQPLDHVDYVGFSSVIAPDVIENGFYTGHLVGKPPTPGTHWNIEARALNGLTSSYGEVGGAEMWKLGTLVPGESVTHTVVFMPGIPDYRRKLKWSQKPQLWQEGEPNIYYGWDEESHNLMDPSTMVADDFRCDSNKPVTAIRWWGSFLNWYDDILPPVMPDAFYLTIWTDTPAKAGDPCQPLIKWSQYPDFSTEGVDVDATAYYPPQQPLWNNQLLADDFNCVDTGKIIQITVWGSWLNDEYPGGLPEPKDVKFTLSIHKDIPDPDGAGKAYSKPQDPAKWMKTFNGPADFIVTQDPPTQISEWYYSPCVPWAKEDADWTCWRYDFFIDPCDTFYQQGTTANPIVYWLDVQAEPNTTDPTIRFGWKSSIDHWNDDAVWAVGDEIEHLAWNELRYPVNHPNDQQSMDLAFEIWTLPESEETYSHPNEVVWDHYCDTYDVNFFGLEYDPHNSLFAPMLSKFEFYQEIPEPNWWYQPNDVGIYWLGIMAMYNDFDLAECTKCGPGSHWVDTCPGGQDKFTSNGILGLDTGNNCVTNENYSLSGCAAPENLTVIDRSGPRDDSTWFPGTRPFDGHMDVIDTEILELCLSGSGRTVRIGAGQGLGPQGSLLASSRGNMAELDVDPTKAEAFFDVYLEYYNGSQYLYNHSPLKMTATDISCIEPKVTYQSSACVPLYTAPVGGTFVMNLTDFEFSLVPSDLQHPWGWETRPNFFMDDAVRFKGFDNLPMVGQSFPATMFEPIEFQGESWDLSFELISCLCCRADFNHDGVIDFGDLKILVAAWLSTPIDADWDPDVNLYPDNIIDLKDFAVFVNCWRKSGL